MGRRPKIAYLLDSRGIKELSAEELLTGQDYHFVANLKDRNREMILMLIEK